MLMNLLAGLESTIRMGYSLDLHHYPVGPE